MQRSYARFVKATKDATESLITEAWAAEIREPPGNAVPEDRIPDLSEPTDTFLKDVRSHLSAQPWRRLAVWARNGDEADTGAGTTGAV